MAKKARKNRQKKSVAKAKTKRGKKSKAATKKTASKKAAPKKTKKAKAKKRPARKAKKKTISGQISGAYRAVMDTIKGTDQLRNKMELPGTSEIE